jgi:hypothetical protein
MDSREIEQIDARLQATYADELPDASTIQQAVRKQIAAYCFRRFAIVE